jgi:hypothetical protein
MSEKVIGLIRTGGVLLLFVIGVILIMNAMGTTATVDPETQEVIEDADKVTGSVAFALYMVYACIAAILLFAVWAIVKNPKKFIPTGIGIAAFLIIGGIGYAMASDAILPDLLEHPNATASGHKWGGTGIKVTFILVFVAIALIAVQSVRNMMKYFSK